MIKVEEGQIWKNKRESNMFIRLEAMNGTKYCYLYHHAPAGINVNTYNFEKASFKNDNFFAGAVTAEFILANYDLVKGNSNNETVENNLSSSVGGDRFEEII